MALTGFTLERTRVAKAAADAGFDLTCQEEGDWLVFRSTAFPASLGVALRESEAQLQFELGVSDPAVGNRLIDEFHLSSVPETGVWSVRTDGIPDYGHLYEVLIRAGALARAVSQSGLREFRSAHVIPPNGTEVLREVTQRVGQDIFRRSLIDYWGGRCAVTGFDVVDLLRASHIKPWSVCGSDIERLDVFNGLLLVPHLDALFDRGLLTFSDEGVLLRSPTLGPEQWEAPGLADRKFQLLSVAGGHRAYLAWHRTNLFRDCSVYSVNG